MNKVDIKIANQCITVTTVIKKSIYKLKDTHEKLATIHNQLIFLNRCKKHELIPSSFRLKLPFKTNNHKYISTKVSEILIKEQIAILRAKNAGLLKHEMNIRSFIVQQVFPDLWTKIWTSIMIVKRNKFINTRIQCINKFNKLVYNDKTIKGKKDQQHAWKKMGKQQPAKVNIVNLSSRELSESENELLKLGLNFVPYNNKINKFDTATEIELASKHDEQQALSKIIKPFFKDNNFGKPNLAKSQKQAIKDLNNDDSIIIQNSDKGNVVVILDKISYQEKLEKIIFSPAYIKLPNDPTKEINNKLDKAIAIHKKKNKKTFPKYLSKSIKNNYSRHPAIYGQVKVHKMDKPLRPIISIYDTVLDKASKYIYKILSNYTKHSPINSTVKNTSDIIISLKKIPYNTNNFLISFDVVNLFGSINVQDCFKLVSGIINSDETFHVKFDIPKQLFLEILFICMNNSYFQYQDEFYKQTNGVPMGSSLSPVLSDIVMTDIEVKIFQLNLASLLNFWKRYVDDILASWIGSSEDLELFHQEINKISPYIKFTMEKEENNSIPFLDIKIVKLTNEFSFTMYSKPTDSGLITNYKSFHPPLVKRNILKNEIRRFKNYSSNFETDKPNLEAKFVNNQYPYHVIEECISQVNEEVPKSKDDEKVNFLNPLNLDNPPKLLVLPYMGAVSKKIKKATKHCNVKIVNKKAKSLGSMFSKGYKYHTGVKSNLIYKINCSCEKFYIGETERLLTKRVEDHERAVRLGYEGNALFQHIKCNKSHKIDWDNIEILGYEPNLEKRKIKEALFIHKYNPALNLNDGVVVRDTWDSYIPDTKQNK